MNAIRQALAIAFASILLVGTARAEDARVRGYRLPDHGTLQLTVPVSWKDEVLQPPDRLPPTIAFAPDKGPSFQVEVSTMWPPSADAPRITPEALLRMVQLSAELARQKAVEPTLSVKTLKGASGDGYYFSATDRAPAPGEFKHLTQGMIRVGEVIVGFTVLTNDGQDDVVAATITMMTRASLAAQ